MSLALSVDEYLKLKSTQTWLIKPLLPVGGTLLLYGDPKAGKSFLALQLAQVLTGNRKDFLGFHPCLTDPPQPVVYVQLDTPRSLWQERLEDLKQRDLSFDRLYLSDRESLDTWPFDILKFEHHSLLRDLVSTHNPSTVIIDTLKETNRCEENKSELQQVVVQALRAATHPAALVLVHHAKKPMDEHVPDLLGDIRGSSYFAGAVDTIMRLTSSGLYYVGRAAEGGVVKTQRGMGGMWDVVVDRAYEELNSQRPTQEPANIVLPTAAETQAWNEFILSQGG